VFCGAGELALRGTRGAARGWFLSAGERPESLSVPADAELLCSSDGKAMAYYLPARPEAGYSLVPQENLRIIRWKEG